MAAKVERPAAARSLRASNEMPVMPEAARIEPAKDAGRPHTQAVCGRPRTQDGEDSQSRQVLRVFLLEALSEFRLTGVRLADRKREAVDPLDHDLVADLEL